MMAAAPGERSATRRRLFAPPPLTKSAAASSSASNTDGDATLAASLAADTSARPYSLRRRSQRVELAEDSDDAGEPATTMKKRRASTRAAKRSRAATPSSASGSEFEEGTKAYCSESDDKEARDESDEYQAVTPSPKKKRASAKSTPKTSDKPPVSPFDVSPRKVQKPIKVNLEAHEAHPAPPRWKETYELLAKQRLKIVAPVDTMGCEENGRDDRRADANRSKESAEDAAKRERLATLVSLMLSSQTKDPVTAEAVYNLQRTLPNGLCLTSLLEADDATISSCIAKVGFWRRKTGYLKSAARILTADFQGDVPRTVDELCSLPGVGPKMAFLSLSSMGIQIGIGVDTHVHRLTNRLGWHKTKNAEETRLNLQSWLPHELHGKINRLLVGFGQVVCVPVGPRCDLCDVGRAGLCPSFREIDSKSTLKRVQVNLLNSDDEDGLQNQDNWIKVKRERGNAHIKVDIDMAGPDGPGHMQIEDLQRETTHVKQEVVDTLEQPEAVKVEQSLDW